MPWPWRKPSPLDPLVICLDGPRLLYAHADGSTGLPRRLLRCGSIEADPARPADLARQLRALAPPARPVVGLLALADCPLLQIEAPAVPPEELKAAARWRIKDMVDGHIDDMTLDVLQVGDGRARGPKQAFVAVAPNRAIHAMAALCEAAGLQLQAIDIRETAQRNLQSALARAAGRRERASALLLRHGEQCLLTITANDELFYARRLDWHGALAPAAAANSGFAPADLTQPLGLLAGADMPDIVDYGSDAADSEPPAGDDAPRIVIELQRSLDLWDRCWPDLPLAAITLGTGEHGVALAAQLGRQLGQRVDVLDVAPAFREVRAACGNDPELQHRCLPLLGALLRNDTRPA